MPDIGPHIRTDYKAVDKRDELRNVMGWVTGDADKLPVVMDDGKPFGIVNERALMGRRLDMRAKVETYTLTTRALSPESTLDEAMARMAEFRAAHLPVADKRGKLAGYIAAIDLARLNGVAERTVGDVAVPVTTLREGNTLGDALHAFNQEYVDYLPVLGKDGRLLGTIARRTILRMEANMGHSRGRKDAGGERVNHLDYPVQDFLDVARHVVRPDARVGAHLDALEGEGYLVVERADGQFVGLVTPQTLARSAR